MLVAALVLIGLLLGFGALRRLDRRTPAEWHRRTLAALSRRSCPSCGSAYGAEAALAALDEHLQRSRAVNAARPHGQRIIHVRDWRIRCQTCGHHARFFPASGDLVAETPAESGPAAS